MDVIYTQNSPTETRTRKMTRKRKYSSIGSDDLVPLDNDSPMKKRKRTKRGERGLKAFAEKICEYVQQHSTTTYNDVARVLVDQYAKEQKEEKNIKRRVYDALNVLIALDIIEKDKKNIKWKGYPLNYRQELEQLKKKKNSVEQKLQQKREELKNLQHQKKCFQNLHERNAGPEYMHVEESSKIRLPFIIVHTKKSTVIECEMNTDATNVFFNFSESFHIHDDRTIVSMVDSHIQKKKQSETEDKVVVSLPLDLNQP